MPQQSDHGREFQRLSEKMRDPRYWRDKDSVYVAKVTEGFQRLFDTADAQRGAERGQAANVAGTTGGGHSRDVIIGHLAPGEIVVPPQALSPAVMAALRQELGDQLPRFIVGSGFERRNPVSGLPAFSPENEEEDASYTEGVIHFLKGLFENVSKGRAGGTPRGTGDPDDILPKNPAFDFLDPHSFRDEHRLDGDQERRERGGGGRKCSPLERQDPLNPACFKRPSS